MEKRKRKPRDIFSIFEEVERLFERDMFEDLNLREIEGGYSISVMQVGNKTTVKVKADKSVDVRKLKEELRRQYPNAEIIIEGGRPIIEEVTEERVKEEKKEERKETSILNSLYSKKSKPRIQEIN